MTDENKPQPTPCPNCPDCPNCQQPEPNKPWVFLGCCLKWDSVCHKNEGWTNGSNITTLLEFLTRNPKSIIWNYACGQCDSKDAEGQQHDGSKCRTVVSIDICQLRNVLDTRSLSDALNFN